MATMEAWLAELYEDSVPTLINNNPHHQYDQSETMEASFDELAATFGDDFPYPLHAANDTASLKGDFGANFIEQFISTTPISDSNDNNNNNNINNDGDNVVTSNVQENQPPMKMEETSVGSKRKRQPSQMQDHIIAERKRRELLSQMFISLSAIVPDLKKMDKTSVLGDAIKHMKQLQEKVKVLEEVVAKRTDSNDNNNNNNINNDGDNIVSSNVQENQPPMKKEETKTQAVSVDSKRKRQPSQVQDHIMAERKRRELLSQMFISLSAIVPGLKKTDKTSVLGDAIKHMKQLQEKVKVLEEVVAKRTVQVESMVVIKKSKLMVDDNGSGDDNVSSSTVEDYCTSGSSGGGSDGGGGADGGSSRSDLLPEIEVKILANTLLLKIYCEKQNGILTKLFTEVDRHKISITNFSVIPFENLALDITIVAQMGNGFDKNVKDFVRSLQSSLRSP